MLQRFLKTPVDFCHELALEERRRSFSKEFAILDEMSVANPTWPLLVRQKSREESNVEADCKEHETGLHE